MSGIKIQPRGLQDLVNRLSLSLCLMFHSLHILSDTARTFPTLITYKMGKRGAENDLNKDNASEDDNSDDVSVGLAR